MDFGGLNYFEMLRHGGVCKAEPKCFDRLQPPATTRAQGRIFCSTSLRQQYQMTSKLSITSQPISGKRNISRYSSYFWSALFFGSNVIFGALFGSVLQPSSSSIPVFT